MPGKKNLPFVVSLVVVGIMAIALIALLVPNLLGLGKYSSPQEVFAAFTAAEKGKQWSKSFSMMTPDKQDQLIGAMVLNVRMTSRFDSEMKDIAERYGIDIITIEPGSSLFSQLNMDSLRKAAAEVKDKRKFYVEMKTKIDKQQKELAQKFKSIKDNADKIVSSIKLSDVEINGDTARGKQGVVFMGRTIGVPILFKKVNGGWLIDAESSVGIPQVEVDNTSGASPFNLDFLKSNEKATKAE